MEKEMALIDAALYLESEPLSVQNLCRITSLGEEVVVQALEKLHERGEAADSGLELVNIGGGWLWAPKREYWETLKERYGRKNEARLSRAAMETLSIIAYSQPITLSEIEAIRGVQADNMIRLLVERGLVHKVGKKDVPGKPVQFGTTKEFLTLFHLSSIADLPKLDESENDRFEISVQ